MSYFRRDESTFSKEDQDWKSKIQKPAPDLRPKTEDVTNRKGMEWDDFNLRKELMMGIVSKGFDFPSPVQEEVIPNVISSIRSLYCRKECDC
jgi:ATP-dependent RNA helicase DDX6/DHH1